MLSDEEKARYQRHLILPGFGPEAQLKLKAYSILVIGAGGLGCPALLYLAAGGFGKIGIVDDDCVSESNLHRQVLYTSADVGLPKVLVACKKLKEANPFIDIVPHQERLTNLNALDIFSGYDIILDGSDNFSTRYLVNDACVILNKPLISGSIFTFEGQVSVFNFMGGPTYRCLFPEPPSEEDMPNCSEIGVLGVLPGVIGTIMATEAIKLASQTGEVLSGKLLVYDALQMSFHKIEFEGKPENMTISALATFDYSCEVQTEITVTELKKWIEIQEAFQLIDVREENEYSEFNIGGLNIPLSKIDLLNGKITKDRKVVIHCKAGSRSKKAISILSEKYGFHNLINLKNGLSEW